MPIARLTNVASFDSVLTEIRNFLNGVGGWTFNINLVGATKDSAAGGTDLVMTNGDVLVGMRSTTMSAGANKLYLFDGIPPFASGPPDSLNDNSGVTPTSSAYSSGSLLNARTTNNAYSGPFPTVTLFTDDPSTYCHVVIEVSSGKFRHLWFGNMEKYGTWTGGAYYCFQRWATGTTDIDNPSNNGSTVPMDGATQGSAGAEWTVHYVNGADKWVAATETTLNGVQRRQARGSVRGGFGQAFRSITETPFSGFIALVPIVCWAWRTSDTPDTIRPIGRIKDVAEVNMKNLVPGESYFIGADEWVVFPVATKGLPDARNDVENSGYYGYAYKVIP